MPNDTLVIHIDTLTARVDSLSSVISSAAGFGWVILGFLATFGAGMFIIKITLRGN